MTVTGGSNTPKTVLLMLDTVEAGIVQEALRQYGRDHIGPVAEICMGLEASLRLETA